MKNSIVDLQIKVYDSTASQENLDRAAIALMNQLREFRVEYAHFATTEGNLGGAKGDPLTVGAIVLGVAVASLPPIISFLQNWVSDRRKVHIQTPNGVQVEFVANKRLSSDEIVALIERLNEIPRNHAS